MSGIGMGKTEKKILGFFEKNVTFIYVAVALIASVLVRAAVFSFESDDMTTFLIGWYQQIEQLGRMKALGVQVGNYNVFYQTIIALLTYFPGDIVVKYKIVSVVFDYVCALGIFFLLYKKGDGESLKQALIGGLIVIFSPVVFMNSAVWGQCDAMYTSFVLLSFAAYKREKNIPCFIFMGLAFACKLQAIFYLPFYLFEWVRKKSFSLLNFLMIPVAMILVCIPAYINGRSFWGFVSPYYYQTGSCNKMSYNYSSFWSIVCSSDEKFKLYVETMKTPAVLLTFIILAGIMTWLLSSKKQLSDRAVFLSFIVFGFTCVEFLPGMHERYAFPIELSVIALALKEKTLKSVVLAVSLNVLSLITYGAELFGGTLNLRIMGMVSFALYLALVGSLIQEVKSAPCVEKNE